MNRRNHIDVPSRRSRNYAVVSLICVVAAAALIALLYRHAAVTSITALGEKSNLILSRFALDLVKPELLDYLSAANQKFESTNDTPALPESLEKAVQEMMRHSSVVRVKIHNRHGLVVFSTNTDQIGHDEHDNPTYVAAMRGRVASKLNYHDAFSALTPVTDDDNLIESYLPVRKSTTTPILGVFEIYEDVSGMVLGMERIQIITLLGLVIILLTVYFGLLLLVRRTDAIIEDQQRTIAHRSQAMEILSAQLLTAQEDERSRLANYLHEELAQDLSALKVHMEHFCGPQCDPGSDEADTGRERTLNILQESIREVRTKAMELRPPSLDDFGLVPTIAWFVRELEPLYPALRIETQINLKEDEIPKPLKTVIYRIVQETLHDIGHRAGADKARIYLRRLEGHITLAIDDNATAYHPVSNPGAATGSGKLGDPASLVERTLLSGGSFSVDSNQQGGTITRSTWPV